MQPLLKQNFFELFDLSPGYSIDTNELASRYRDLQQVVHPDRFANAPEQERRLSMQCATHVNEAFQTLKQPLLRARYLLELRGVSFEQSMTMPPEFLMEQIELREEMEALSGLTALMKLRNNLQVRIVALQQQFSEYLDVEGNDDALLVFNKMQFLSRLQEELDAQEEQMTG